MPITKTQIPVNEIADSSVVARDCFVVHTKKGYEMAVEQTLSVSKLADGEVQVTNLYSAHIKLPKLAGEVVDGLVISVEDGNLSRILNNLDKIEGEIRAAANQQPVKAGEASFRKINFTSKGSKNDHDLVLNENHILFNNGWRKRSYEKIKWVTYDEQCQILIVFYGDYVNEFFVAQSATDMHLILNSIRDRKQQSSPDWNDIHKSADADEYNVPQNPH